MPDDGLTLAAISRGAGMLAPAGVCRVGRCIAEVLGELHERGGGCAPTAENVIVDDAGGVLFIPAGARSQPLLDLHALGVMLSELSLGHPFGGSAGIRTLGTGLPDRLVDALEVLVAPEDTRLRHASAAVRMFTELEKLYGDGAAALVDAVMRTRKNAMRDTVPTAAQIEPRTIEMPRDATLSLDDLKRIDHKPAPTAAPAPINTAIIDASELQPPRPSVNLNAARVDQTSTMPSARPSSGAHAEKRRVALVGAAFVAVVVLLVVAFFAGVHFGAHR